MAAWNRLRVVGVLALVVLAAFVLGVFAHQERRGYLDPEGIDAWGARAVVRVLEDQGVEVHGVRTTDAATEVAGEGTTVLVTIPDRLLPRQVEQILDTGADIVLAAPGAVVSTFAEQVTVTDVVDTDVREPGCDLPEAQRAGPARTGGLTYAVGDAGVSCYHEDGAGSLVVVTLEGGARLTALGSADTLVNLFLDEEGNAALALGLLGRNPQLVWYWPALEAIDEADAAPPAELLPEWVTPVAWQLAIAAVLAALWRGRRLGPVVTEPLPVVVRASETTEGRARLYRRGRARGHAADTLREATVQRLRSRLGLPRDVDPSELVRMVAARSRRPRDEVNALLAGAEPPDDASLIRLADDLDALEQEVRTL